MSERFVCVECGQAFILSYAEQRAYRERGHSLPKRCDVCRAQRRQARDSGLNDLSGSLTGSSSAALRRPPANPSRPSAFTPRIEPGSPSRPSQRSIRSWWASPYGRFGLLSLGLVLLIVIAAGWFLSFSVWIVILTYTLAINLVTLLLYRYDKFIAGGDRTRVPERILLGLALFGGWPAAFIAMYQFKARHKTQKFSFWGIYWAIVALYILLILGYLNWAGYL